MPEPMDLCVPIYLNQKAIFDLLAMAEHGFSEFHDVTSSNSGAATTRSDLEASVSVSNVLQFIGLALKDGVRRSGESEDRSENLVAQRKVHTPASLFCRLRSLLNEGDDSPVRKVEGPEDLQWLSAGEFVEFRAILRKNPLVDLFETLTELAGFGLLLGLPALGGFHLQPDELPVELPDARTKVKGPAILVLPMAIFV